MIVELHLLQNFAPSNLNRDETGQPKSCLFGGYQRARVSSQCVKRAARMLVKERRWLAAENEDTENQNNLAARALKHGSELERRLINARMRSQSVDEADDEQRQKIKKKQRKS